MTYPVKGLHYGPALAVTLWTQAGSIAGLTQQLEQHLVILNNNKTTRRAGSLQVDSELSMAAEAVLAVAAAAGGELEPALCQ